MASGNGHARAEITEAEWHSMQRRVDGLEDEVPKVGALMGELGRTRATSEKTANHVLQLDVDVKHLSAQVSELLGWKEDSKVMRIADLAGQVSALEREKAKAAEDEKRDRLDRHRSVFAAVLTFIVTVSAAVVVDWFKRGGH